MAANGENAAVDKHEDCLNPRCLICERRAADYPFVGLTPPYSTIVADPPWQYPEGFATQSRTPGKWKGPVQTKALPYSALSLAAIKSLPVADLAGADTRLFLWTTNRYLHDAFGVADAWGFRYKQALVWHKRDGNMGGSVAPCSAEFLLVAVKGSPPVLSKAASAVISAPQSKQHSKKPAAFGDLIEQVSPGPYVELFARAPRLGWDSWGYGYESEAGPPDRGCGQPFQHPPYPYIRAARSGSKSVSS